MRDVTQGYLLLALSFFLMFLYFYAILLAPQEVKFLGRTISDWAVIIPVMVIVYLFLIILAWIGWAMATTPPPLPLIGKKLEEGEMKKKSQLQFFNLLAIQFKKNELVNKFHARRYLSNFLW